MVLAAAAIATGCSSDKKSSTMPMSASALTITPAPAAQYTPPPAPQPVVEDVKPEAQPAIADSVADASDTITPSAPAPRTAHAARTQVASHHTMAASSVKGTKYTIKKGDSLWSIAVTKYGNGNKWKQIAAANPKINPNKVIVGQTITLP